MNFYPHHIGDYGSATAHLTMLEDAAYRRLIDWYYQDERPLPVDKHAIYRRVRAASIEERQAVDDILTEFFTLDGDVYRHSRCDSELVKMREKSAKAKQSADKGWAMRGKTSDAIAMRTHSERIATNSGDQGGSAPNGGKTPEPMPSQCERNANASTEACERIDSGCEGNAPNNHKPITNSQREKKEARGIRLPLDFPDADAMNWAQGERPDLKTDAVAESFRDYWLGVPGQKGRKADWPATWRNWVRNQRSGQQARASPGALTAAEKRSRTMAALTGQTQPDYVDVIATERRFTLVN